MESVSFAQLPQRNREFGLGFYGRIAKITPLRRTFLCNINPNPYMNTHGIDAFQKVPSCRDGRSKHSETTRHSETTTSAAEGTDPILNIAAYKFVALDNLEQRREQLKRLCTSLELFGTILLSVEGINLFLAGRERSVRVFMDELRAEPEFADLEPKESFSESIPFRRMLVRLKKEIISFGIESVRPAERSSPKLPAQELKRWLDEGKQFRLLDTRNDYEVDLGTFHGAEHLSIGHFREFPKAIRELPEEAKKEPLVMFCTGGIRCEKAGPLMEQAGFEQVYQLDGGILKYFEDCGGAHYDGSCFVFDGRVALDPALQPTGNLLCFACQAVLGPDDIASDKFMFGKFCPNCYVAPDDIQRREFEEHQAVIRQLASAQPGCEPYDNLRRIHVAGRFTGMKLLDFLQVYQPAIAASRWQQWIDAGEIIDEQTKQSATPSQIVREGQCFEQHMPNTVEPRINPDIQLLHEDSSILVVSKPAPLPTHPSGRYNKNTLLKILSGAYPHEKLRVAHRLDANTTGLVVLCRKHQSARVVQPQFDPNYKSNRSFAENLPPVEKTYLALVHGHPSWDEKRCEAGISAAATGQSGIRSVTDDGLTACTEFRVLERREDGRALVEAKPLTGRTNQIRIHLWHLNHAIVGDPLYLPDGDTNNTQTGGTLSVDDLPMCLHASRLTFTHPESMHRVTFNADLPNWLDSAM